MPGMSKGTPAVTTSRSPGCASPRSRIWCRGHGEHRLVVGGVLGQRRGHAPHEGELAEGLRLRRAREDRHRRAAGRHLARGEAAAGEADDERRATASPPRRRRPPRSRPRCGPARSAPGGDAAACTPSPDRRPSAASMVTPRARPLHLHLARDAVHRPHRLERVLADRGLRREHDRVGAVEDGVGHVRGLGAGRPRRVDHGLQHLGGGDHRLAVQARPRG